MSVKNIRVEVENGYIVGESLDGKTIEGSGKKHFTSGPYISTIYEGYFKNSKYHGFGNILK